MAEISAEAAAAWAVEIDPVADSKESKASSSSSQPDLKQLQELYDLMKQEGLESVELQSGDTHIKLSRVHRSAKNPIIHHHASPMVAPSAPAPSAVSGASDPNQSITSPLAGIFYRASSPSKPPFVKEGDVVDAGQTLCIVEAMKVMNEIKAESHCRIIKIQAENSRPVTAGQSLFLVEPA